jgi:hypothetical protein
MKNTLIFLGLAGLAGLLAAGCAAVRAGYQSAPYRVTRSDGKFQLRDYPGLTVVETAAPGPDNSFMRLFHYIGGQNSAQQKIPMTTPVFMAGSRTNSTMAFVLPANLPLERAPHPADPTLRLRQIPAGSFAVLRFSGGRSDRHAAEALTRLQAWLTAQSLTAAGEPPVYAYFDPPWTPSFLRRNEVMLRLAPTK